MSPAWKLSVKPGTFSLSVSFLCAHSLTARRKEVVQLPGVHTEKTHTHKHTHTVLLPSLLQCVCAMWRRYIFWYTLVIVSKSIATETGSKQGRGGVCVCVCVCVSSVLTLQQLCGRRGGRNYMSCCISHCSSSVLQLSGSGWALGRKQIRRGRKQGRKQRKGRKTTENERKKQETNAKSRK